MTVTADFSLITHLLRRAGLGFSYGEIEQYAALGYEGFLPFHMEDTPGSLNSDPRITTILKKLS